MKKEAIVIISLIIIPLFLFAQEAGKVNYGKICEQAKAMAQKNVSEGTWFTAGFLFGLLGVGAAYLAKPEPPIEEILNKPPDYVTVYRQCYMQEGQKIQQNSAWKGCIVSILLDLILIYHFTRY